jgi:hypothetical protein
LKRIIAVLALFAFGVVLAGAVFAQMDTRTPDEKLAAGRAYLKLLDAKIIKYREQGNQAKVKLLRGEKVSLIARMKMWKAEMEAAQAPPPPPPAPVPPPPPPPPMVEMAPPPAVGMFGWGIKTSADVGYIFGDKDTSSFLADGAIVLSDPMAIGSMIGLTEDAINYKIGLGLTAGDDRNGNTFNAILITGDGILNLPAEALGGIKSYVGGQINYPIYKTEDRPAGKIGALLYFGVKGDLGLGLGGDSYAELGYGAIRREGFSTKGIELKVGQELLL